MTYTKNIPLTGESLGSTRARIAENFLDNFTVQAVNHVSFNDSGAGKHKFMQMPEQGSSPSTAVDEAALYTKVGTSPAETTLFYRAESNGFEYQMTRPIAAQVARFASNAQYVVGPPSLTGGWTFLPGNLLLQWGSSSPAASTSTFTYTFPVAFTTACFNIQITGLRGASNPGTSDSWVVSGFTTTGFQIYNNGSHSFQFMWQAIGI